MLTPKRTEHPCAHGIISPDPLLFDMQALLFLRKRNYSPIASEDITEQGEARAELTTATCERSRIIRDNLA